MKVMSKQWNSRGCIICGMDNPLGVKAQFYNMEDKSVISRFSYSEHHQSYPGRVHGGMITAMLDELGLRVLWANDIDEWGVTMSLETKFRKPVPYNVPLMGMGVLLSSSSKFVMAEAYIFDDEGNKLADAKIKYIKLKPELISDTDFHEEMMYHIEDDITEIDIKKTNK